MVSLKMILSLPKIVWFNFKVFPARTALKLPIWIHYHTKIGKVQKGCIEIDKRHIKPGMIKLGCSMGSAGVFTGEYPASSGGGYLNVKPGCKLIFKGKAVLAGGFSVRLDNGGILEFGENFGCNSYCFFAANSVMRFGKNCTLGWKINVRDSDGHALYNLNTSNKEPFNKPREILIGDHVWIAACVDILKGTVIPKDSVVAYGTLLSGQKFNEENTIIGGNPPKVLKRDISWKF